VSSTSPPTSVHPSSSTTMPAGTGSTTVGTTHGPSAPAPTGSPVAGGQAPAADPVRVAPTYTG
jgi:hypothetical protein